MELFTFIGLADNLFTLRGDYYKEYLWVCILTGFLCYAVIYVFEFAALYAIAKREGYKNRWMALVPFFNTYYIGVVSEKNKTYNVKPANLALAAAIAEFCLTVLYVIYYVAVMLVFKGKYAVPQTVYEENILGYTVESFTGTYVQASDMPESLNWAYWCFANLNSYVMSWVELIYIITNAFVLVSFFRTYSSARYVMFSVFAIIFPVKAFLMFAVRNNRGKNYGEYLRARQAQQYEAYKEYIRRNGHGGGTPYDYNPYSGRPVNRDGDNPYGGSSSSSQGDDPFDEFSSSDGKSGSGSSSDKPDDPFSDF